MLRLGPGGNFSLHRAIKCKEETLSCLNQWGEGSSLHLDGAKILDRARKPGPQFRLCLS